MRSSLRFVSLALAAGVVASGVILSGARAQYGLDATPKSRWSSRPLREYGADKIPGASTRGRIEPAYGLDVPPNIQYFPTPEDAYYVWSGGVHETQARDEARLLKWYSMAADVPAGKTARGHAQEIREDLTAAREEFSHLSKKMRADKTAAKHLQDIDQHLTKAIEACDKMDEHCAQGKCDPKALGACSARIDRELLAANAAHVKLLQHYAPQEGDVQPAGKAAKPKTAAGDKKPS